MGNVVRRALQEAADLANADGPPTLVGGKVVHHANIQGRLSDGCCTRSGNGGLALTKRDLLFVLAAPHRVDRIPLRSVTSVRVDTSFLGQCHGGRPMLVVEWVRDDGADDAAGWLLLSATPVEAYAAAVRGAVEAARGAAGGRR